MHVYEQYLARHEHLGRLLAVTVIAFEIAKSAAASHSGDQPIAAIVGTDEKRTPFVISGYRRRATRTWPPVGGTVADFVADLNDLTPTWFELIVVRGMSAFEEAVKQYGTMVVERELARGNRSSELVELLRLSYLPRQSPTLAHLYRTSEQVRQALSEIPAVFRRDALGDRREVSLGPGWSAYSVAEMWRDVRNCLVHRRGVVGQPFFDRYESMWRGIYLAATSHDSLPSEGSTLTVGQPLVLSSGHVIYCLMSCQQVVKALGDLLEPTQVRRRVSNPLGMTVPQVIGQTQYGARCLGERRQDHIDNVGTWLRDDSCVTKIASSARPWQYLGRLLFHASWLDKVTGRLAASQARALIPTLPRPVDAEALSLLLKNSRDASRDDAAEIARSLLSHGPDELFDRTAGREHLAHFLLWAWRCEPQATRVWVQEHAGYWNSIVVEADALATGQFLAALTVVNQPFARALLEQLLTVLSSKISTPPEPVELPLCGVLALHDRSRWDDRVLSTAISTQQLLSALGEDRDLILGCWALQSVPAANTSLIHEVLSARAQIHGRDWALPPLLGRFPAPWNTSGLLGMLEAWEQRPFSSIDYAVIALGLWVGGPLGGISPHDLHAKLEPQWLAQGETRDVAQHLARRLLSTALHRGTLSLETAARGEGNVRASGTIAAVYSWLLDPMRGASGNGWLSVEEWDGKLGVPGAVSVAQVDAYRTMLLETGCIRWRVVVEEDAELRTQFAREAT